jgi:hypothetical protein
MDDATTLQQHLERYGSPLLNLNERADIAVVIRHREVQLCMEDRASMRRYLVDRCVLRPSLRVPMLLSEAMRNMRLYVNMIVRGTHPASPSEKEGKGLWGVAWWIGLGWEEEWINVNSCQSEFGAHLVSSWAIEARSLGSSSQHPKISNPTR